MGDARLAQAGARASVERAGRADRIAEQRRWLPELVAEPGHRPGDLAPLALDRAAREDGVVDGVCAERHPRRPHLPHHVPGHPRRGRRGGVRPPGARGARQPLEEGVGPLRRQAHVDRAERADRRIATGPVARERCGQPRPRLEDGTAAAPHHPGDLVPPRDARTIKEAGRHEEHRRDPVGPQDRIGSVVVVAVAVVERQRHTAPPPRPERLGQLVAGDDLHLARQEAHLLGEVVRRRTPEPHVVHPVARTPDAVVAQDEHPPPRRDPGQDGPGPGPLEHPRRRLTAPHGPPPDHDSRAAPDGG